MKPMAMNATPARVPRLASFSRKRVCDAEKTSLVMAPERKRPCARTIISRGDQTNSPKITMVEEAIWRPASEIRLRRACESEIQGDTHEDTEEGYDGKREGEGDKLRYNDVLGLLSARGKVDGLAEEKKER